MEVGVVMERGEGGRCHGEMMEMGVVMERMDGCCHGERWRWLLSWREVEVAVVMERGWRWLLSWREDGGGCCHGEKRYQTAPSTATTKSLLPHSNHTT